METDPLVSILIPAYDAQDWIADTIRSALAQTWTRTEIVIVDDGSRDDTLAVAQTFSAPHVKIVASENEGAAAARNRAYSHAQGDYIQWLDADDLLGPDKIERQIRARGEGDTERTLLSSPWAYFAYRPRRARFDPTDLWCDLQPADWLVRKMGQHLFMQTSTWLTSRTLAEAAGPWDPRLSFDDDGEYFCRVLLASDGSRFVPDANVYYRDAAIGSVSHIGFSDAKMDALLLSMQLHIGYLRSLEQSERVTAACLDYIHTWATYIDPTREDIAAELDAMAGELGGRFTPPSLRPKFEWMSAIVGRAAAWRAQTTLPHYKRRVACAWDRLADRAEGAMGVNRFPVDA